MSGTELARSGTRLLETKETPHPWELQLAADLYHSHAFSTSTPRAEMLALEKTVAVLNRFADLPSDPVCAFPLWSYALDMACPVLMLALGTGTVYAASVGYATVGTDVGYTAIGTDIGSAATSTNVGCVLMMATLLQVLM